MSRTRYLDSAWHGQVRDLRVRPVTMIFVAGRRQALMIAASGAVVL